MGTNNIKEKILKGALIIDVRTPEEYKGGFYKGAINIPVNVLETRMSEIGPKDSTVIVYCASGGRSAVAHSILKARGFTDVLNGGGIDDMPK